MKKKLSVFFLYFFLIVYLEFINKIVMFNKLPDINFFVVLLFSVSLAFLCSFVSVLGKEKTNKRITFVLFLLITAFYLANFLYYSLFSLPFSITDLELVSNALSFYEIGLHLINTDFIPILLFLLPFFVFLLYKKDFDYEKKALNKNALNFIGTFAFYILALLGLNMNKEELYSPYHLYYNLDAITKSTEVLGLFTSQRINFKRYLFGFQEKIVAEKSIPVQDDQVEYNKLDIDFDTLIANEKNPEIKQIYEYLKNKKATNKNEYTGMYKGKNLIFILAEGFNSIAVDEQRTPTLYKLIHEGFDFSNYYSPEFLSTTGGEFQAMTGLLPTQEILSIWRNQHPLISYAIGNSFKKYGYNTFSYHNWYYKYYNRNVTMPTLGFNNFMACQNGMEKKINCSWLPSDVDMIDATFDSYSKNDPFVTYYITVSGHAPYNFMGGNKMANKNREKVEDLPYSTAPKAYLAAQLELEYALSTLLDHLKEEGILEDTVIVLTGDHYPYTLTEEEINEISSYERDEMVEVHHSNLIIWNVNNKHVDVPKVSSQIDVLPTILNLFGIPYDSRLLIGNDIFSNEEGLAIFASRSWRSDRGIYYMNKGFVGDADEEYISKINNRIANAFTISKLLLENDIYSQFVLEEGE